MDDATITDERAWFVAYLTWILGLADNQLELPRPAVTGLASLAGFPVSILVAECALRRGPVAIVSTCINSVLLLFGLALTADGASLVILPLLFLAQMGSLADAAALASGAVATADPARRGAALAVFARLAVAAANQCRYCTAHQRHQLAARRFGDEDRGDLATRR